MNSSIDISIDQKSNSATEEIANSLQQMELVSDGPSIHPSISQSSNANQSPIQEDVVMSEGTPSVDLVAPPTTPSVPVSKLDNLYKQKDKLLAIIDSLTAQNLDLLAANDIESRKMREDNNTKLASAHEMHHSLVKLITSEIELKSKDKNLEKVPTKPNFSSPDTSAIKSSDLPKFNVNPTASALYQLTLRESKGQTTSSNNESSLDLFIREFERRFLDKNISVDDHWLHYLEICFERSDKDFDWFVRHLKRPIKEFKRPISWNQAKQLLRQKYDLASQTTPLQWLQFLLGFNQHSSETLTETMDRFRLFCLGANVNMDNNVLLIYMFISRLHSQKFRDLLLKTVKESMAKKSNASTTNLSSMDSIYAPCNQPLPFPASWNEFESILVKEMATLENALVEIVKDKSSHTNKRSLDVSSGNDKRIKLSSTSNQKAKEDKNSTSTVSFFKQIAELKKKGICTFCKTAKYTVEHTKVCEARKNYQLKKNSANVSTSSKSIIQSQDKHVGSLEVSLNTFNTTVNPTIESAIKNNDTNSSFLSDDSQTDDEFEMYYKQYDEDLFSSNKDNITSDQYNKSVFAVRNNKVGDIDNPFSSDSVSFSPVTPITLNNVNTYGIIDTGANISVINQQFAIEHDIKFRKISGSLILANGNKIARMQTVDLVNVEYDNIDHVVQHRFDVIEDDIMSYENKILLGIDLLPKLSIHLMNVAVKHKGLKKELDDSIPDKAYEPNVSPAGTVQEQKAFDAAIHKYIDANKNLNKSSLCNITEAVLYLPTPPGYVANVRQYPIPYALKSKVMEVINGWLADGIIIPAKPSAWNLPMTVTQKKNLDGTKTDKIRLVLDPRMLNKVLPADNHQLPLISDIFQSMSGATVFSTLDLKSAFNQFPVNEQDQIKTTFTAPNNLQYMYRGAPFGISTISQLFSRTMLTLFKDLPYVKCFVDDICIASSSMHAHFFHVKKVLEILTKANLRVNFEKTHLAKSAVYLLGYSISAVGKKIDSRKVTNIHEWPRPITQKQVQSFLGFVNYFRIHTPNAALLMAPLDALRCHDEKGNGPFEWTKTHQMHFDSIKHILSSDLTLSHPDLSYPFCIATDASDYSIGCCLYQEYEVTNTNSEKSKVKKYIGFMSRSLSKSEKMYSVTMRELLGVVYALKQFHKFIWGTHFTLYTDHKALCYIHSQKNANSMLIKWLDIILDYSFTVVHVSGLDNVLPDKLSRLYPPKDVKGEIEDVKKTKRLHSSLTNHATSDTINDKKKLKDSRYSSKANNASVNSISVDSISPSSPNDVSLTSNLNNHNNQKIFYIQSGQSIYKDYLSPPKNENQQLLNEAHNQTGHYGAEQMVKRLHNQGIHWPNLISDCIQYIRQCTDCMKHNIAKKGYHPLRSIYSYYPGDHYAIDLGGPISTSSTYNNNYFMVIIDVCTRFCIIKPLTDKKSDTIVRTLVDVFSIMGFPTKLQSDNGTEFKNSLTKALADAMGYDHRFITPLHASANGLSERFVQSVKKMLAKATNGVGNDWDTHLPAIQLALNNRISKRLNSSPFSLMFARKMNEPHGFRSDKDKLKQVEGKPPMSHEELMKRIDYMTDIVFPAIVDKTKAQVELEQAKFNDSHKLVDYAPGSHVMVRIPTKNGQLAPVYEGPYTVVRKNAGNAYILRDETGVLMPRHYTSTELKLISKEEVVELDDEGNEVKSYEIEAVINHRGPANKREYLVRWKHYSSDWDEWLTVDKFNDPNTLRTYWKNLGKPYTPPKNLKITNSPSSSEVLKTNCSGTISSLMNELSSDDESDVKKSRSNSTKVKRPSTSTSTRTSSSLKRSHRMMSTSTMSDVKSNKPIRKSMRLRN